MPNRKLARAIIECLEPRRMLAVINGTTGNDIITIASSFGLFTNVVINGTSHTTQDQTIVVNGDNGSDAISISSMRSSSTITVNGGGGNDLLQNTVNDLDSVYSGSFTFIGGAGADHVAADNGADATAGGGFRIQGDRIIKEIDNLPDDSLLLYSQIESLDFADNNNSNTIRFLNLQGSGVNVANVTIRGHGGNDTITNTTGVPGYWPTSIGTSGLRVEGGPGSDTLLLNNESDSSGAYTINSSTIDVNSAFSNAGPLTYVDCELIDFDSAGHTDNVILNGKPSGTAIRFDSNDGDDIFLVGGGDINTNGFLLSNSTLLGGAGSDTVLFDDHLDAEGEVETYRFAQFVLDKGGAGFSYSGFEAQRLDAADRAISFHTPNTINIDQTSTQITSTIINGAATQRDNFIRVTQGSLFNLNGTLTLNTPGAVVTINDHADTQGYLYEFDQSQFRRPHLNKTINYVGVATMTINTAGANMFIDGVPAGMSLTVNGSASNDYFLLGRGNVDADLLGPVTINGGPGIDEVDFSNFADTTFESQALNGLSFTDGQTHTFTAIESLGLDVGNGGTNMSINATGVATSVHGGNGNDSFTVGTGDLDAELAPGAAELVINGLGGIDSIRFDDLIDTNLDEYIFDRTTDYDRLNKRDGGVDHLVNWRNVEGITLDASNAATPGPTDFSQIRIVGTTTPLRINGNAGSDKVLVEDTSVPVTVHSGLGALDALIVNSDADATPATVVMDQSDDAEDLRVLASGTLRVLSGAVLVKTRNLTPAPLLVISGALDLAGGAFISGAGGPSQTQWHQQISNGYNNGSWNGTASAICSSLAAASSLPDAIGYGLGSEIAINSIGGFNIAPGDTLIRYTRYGDADLNGVVNFDDYARTDAGFLNNRTGWVNGDFDFNNVVNFDDYALIDRAFLSQGAGRSGTGKG